MMNCLLRSASLPAAALLASIPAFSQPAPLNSPTPVILNVLTVNDNLDRTEEFYHRLLGLESNDGDPRARLAWYPESAPLEDMYGVKGNTRNFFLKVPGSNLLLEPEQFSAAPAKKLDTHIQDPGAVQFIFETRDIDTLTGFLMKGGAKVLTAGRKPVAVADETGSAREIWFEDFNGFFVKLIQHEGAAKAQPAGVAPPPFISGVTVGITAEDSEKTARFYHDVLGLDVKVPAAFSSDPQRLEAFGLKNAEYRESAVVFAAEKATPLHFFEFKGVRRVPLHPATADPNSVLIRINVPDIDATLAKVKAAGAPIVSKSGGITQLGKNKFLVITDPNGVHLQLVERVP